MTTSLNSDRLFRAATNGNDAVILQCLKNGVPIDSVDKEGRTALILACYSGQERCVRTLCSARPPPNPNIQAHSYWRGRTALMMACGHGNTDCVAALLESGLAIDLELRDGNGMHALQLSATTEIKQMLRKYRAQVEAEALARQLEEEEQEAERRAAEDAEMAEREREEAQVRAELEALVEAKNHAEAEEQKKVAELQFLKSELETALWKMCEAQTAHLTCPNDLAAANAKVEEFKATAETHVKQTTVLTQQVSLLTEERDAAVTALQLSQTQTESLKTRTKALQAELEATKTSASAAAQSASRRELELISARDEALSECERLRVALQDLTEERRTLLHDSGQFAHTHSSMLKTMSDDCEAARRERDRARAEVAQSVIDVAAARADAKKVCDEAQSRLQAVLLERDQAAAAEMKAIEEKLAALHAVDEANALTKAAQIERDTAERRAREADAKAALESIAREFAVKERERAEQAADRIRERSEQESDRARERAEQTADRARAREEAALAHMEDREKQYMQKWQEADARAEAAEHALTKMGHEKSSLEEDIRRAEVLRAELEMKIQATQTERDQLNEKCSELSSALHSTQTEAAAAAEKAMQEAKSLRDEIAEQVAAVAAAHADIDRVKADGAEQLRLAHDELSRTRAKAAEAQTEFEASLTQLQKAHDETNLALQKSERDRQEAAATSAADLQAAKSALSGAERRLAAIASDNARAHAEWAKPSASGSATPVLNPSHDIGQRVSEALQAAPPVHEPKATALQIPDEQYSAPASAKQSRPASTRSFAHSSAPQALRGGVEV